MRPFRRLGQSVSQSQSSIKQKHDREISTLVSLMQLPDCDVTEFFQQLMKNKNYEQILDEISEQKKIDFFAKNYRSFLQTQDELMSLKVPVLSQIPRAREFHLRLGQSLKEEQDGDQAAVIEIIDSFSTYVLQKNTSQVMRIYNIILQMKSHSRYSQYFYSYRINKLFRQAFSSFVENCRQLDVLVALDETVAAIRVFLGEKEVKVFQKINGELNIDSSVGSLRGTLSYLLKQIQQISDQFKTQFMGRLQRQPQFSLYLSNWISHLSLTYYNSIQAYIYQQQQISDILHNLSEILQISKQSQSKGISLYRQLRNNISNDLPLHLMKIIQVVLDSFDDELVLKFNNDLYQFIEVKSLNAIAQMVDRLNVISIKDYGKKCCSKKGILLVNSLLVILLPLCDDKWMFLHENIIQAIVDKVKANLQQQKMKLQMWDYYHLFMLFYQLAQGKVRHNVMFDPLNSSSSYLKDKITKIKRLADDCRFVFENMMVQSFWNDILSSIPQLLWQFRKYAQSSQRSTPKPTVFSISLVFSLEQFFKQIEFRLSKQHYEYLGIQFYQYIIFVIQYILFWSYHQRGQNTKVFTLYKKQQKLLTKARQMFAIQELGGVKNKEILKLSYFTRYGLERLVVDLYFLSDVYKILLNGCQKIRVDEFLFKLSRILAKELKNEPLQTDRRQYQQLLRQFINVYENQPQVIKKYLNERRAVSSKSQRSIGNSSTGSNKKRYIEDDDNNK